MVIALDKTNTQMTHSSLDIRTKQKAHYQSCFNYEVALQLVRSIIEFMAIYYGYLYLFVPNST